MPGTRSLLIRSCKTCGAQPARYYYLGWRCTTHAPSEGQVREHAIARATTNDARPRAPRERATPPPRETR